MHKYYYVKYNGRWTVAEWRIIEELYDVGYSFQAFYFLPGKMGHFERSDFDEIGDEILMPSEDA